MCMCMYMLDNEEYCVYNSVCMSLIMENSMCVLDKLILISNSEEYYFCITMCV